MCETVSQFLQVRIGDLKPTISHRQNDGGVARPREIPRRLGAEDLVQLIS